MKYYFTLLVIIGLISCKGTRRDKTSIDPRYSDHEIKKIVNQSSTAIICVRHAEKRADSEDPGLTPLGTVRANDLSNLLDNISIDVIYSSDYNRTRQTAEPLSAALEISVQQYDPSDLRTFSNLLMDSHMGDNVVVVGHSNTTPKLANLLCENDFYEEISHDEYDQIFLITIDKNGKTNHQIMEYGKASPETENN